MSTDLQTAFVTLCERLQEQLQGDEQLWCSCRGELTDFARFNNSKLGQAGHVRQLNLDLRLITGQKVVAHQGSISGDLDEDLSRWSQALTRCRSMLALVPDDPHLHLAQEVVQHERRQDPDLPAAAEGVATLLDAAQDLDVVGHWASGSIVTGLYSSLGHRSWDSVATWCCDWSCYLEGDKAVKCHASDSSWNSAAIVQELTHARQQLPALARPPKEIKPGSYRAWFTPDAVSDLAMMLAWGGCSTRSRQTHTSVLEALFKGEASLSPLLHLSQEQAQGMAPMVTKDGYHLPDQVTLFTAGQAADSLTDARSAAEFDLPVNAAMEYPSALRMGTGQLSSERILQELDTGIWVANLHYCNWSDRNSARITGMTRFATFWVENGEIVAPLSVMRFDDSLYNMLGKELIALGDQAPMQLATGTYGSRSTSCSWIPGALVANWRLAL